MNIEEQQIRDLFDFSKSYNDKKEKLTGELGFNLIDNLPINEIANSRILSQLLQFQFSGEYVVLQSFLDYIALEHPDTKFGNIKIEHPIISQEKANIDIWICDKNYAIILENKIYNAKDQSAQIKRYIDYTKKAGYREEDIFVVYLPSCPSNPDIQSWGDYKESFKHRYCSLSYSEDILLWLKKLISPVSLLYSGLVQYEDYLEGFSGKRERDYLYDMELTKIIEDRLNLLPCGSKERFEQLLLCANQMKQLTNKIDLLIEEAKTKYWEFQCEQDHPGICKAEGFPLVNRVLLFQDIEYVLSIGIDYSRLYCQLERRSPQERVPLEQDQLLKKIKDSLPKVNEFQAWEYYNFNDIEGVYRCFSNTWLKLECLGCIFKKN